MTAAVLVLAAAAVLSSCRPDGPGRAARAFVDALLVRLDHDAAGRLAVGRAREKVAAERRSLPAEPVRAEERAHIFYRETGRASVGDAVRVTFSVRAVVRGDEALRRRVTVYLRRVGGQWRVFDYEFRQDGEGTV